MGIKDFVTEIDSTTLAMLPFPIELNIYLYPDSDFVELSIDYTPMLFDLEKELTTIDEKLKLVWNNSRFLIYNN